MTYNTSEPALRVNTLECGLDYTLKVMSYNGTCVSRPSVLPVSQSKGELWHMFLSSVKYETNPKKCSIKKMCLMKCKHIDLRLILVFVLFIFQYLVPKPNAWYFVDISDQHLCFIAEWKQMCRRLKWCFTALWFVDKMYWADLFFSLPQRHVCQPMWWWIGAVASVLWKWLGKRAAAPCPTRQLRRIKMAGIWCAPPMRRLAGWRAWCAARSTVSGWLPWTTAAPAIRALWRHYRQVENRHRLVSNYIF